jgi:protein tyrosine/serine phosphatase
MKRLARFFLLSLVSCSSLLGQMASASHSKVVADLPNFREVTANLYRGGRPTLTGLKTLAGLRIKTIINLQGGDLHTRYGKIGGRMEPGEFPEAILREGFDARELGMEYFSFPLDSVDRINPSEEIEIAEILELMKTPDAFPIYIHCEHGKDRTGLMVAIERVEQEGWTPLRARAEWIALGHTKESRLVTGKLDDYFFTLFPKEKPAQN